MQLTWGGMRGAHAGHCFRSHVVDKPQTAILLSVGLIELKNIMNMLAIERKL